MIVTAKDKSGVELKKGDRVTAEFEVTDYYPSGYVWLKLIQPQPYPPALFCNSNAISKKQPPSATGGASSGA